MSPLTINLSFRKEEPDAAADLEEAELELRHQRRALVGPHEILSFQSQVLEAPATPDLCQIGRFTSSSCPRFVSIEAPLLFPKRPAAQHLKSLTTLVKRD